MTIPPVIAAAYELLDNGISVVPLVTGTKKAACEWKPLQTKLMDHEELANWIPNYGTGVGLGIITGALSGIVVVEGDSPEAVAWIQANLPYTPRKVQTKRGMHFYYRHPGRPVKTNANEMAPKVDVRGDGGLVVAPPSKDRTWVLEPGADWDSLPMFEAPAIKRTGNLIAIDFAAVHEARQGGMPHSIGEGGRNQAITKAAGRLFRMGDSFEEVLDFCSALNRTMVPPLPDKEVFATVRSIFASEQRRRAEAGQLEVAIPDASRPVTGIQLPDWVLSPGGVLGSLMAYAEQSSPYYHPVFALGAALVTLGGLLGRKVATPSNLRTNLYLMACGPSGTGKEAARQAMVRALSRAGADDMIGPEQFVSPAAIVKTLRANPTCIAYLDEFGHQIRAARRDGSHAAGNLAMMTKLFSYAGSQYMGDDYASLERTRVTIEQPHLCIYATSVPGRIFDNLTPDDVTDGFLPRWLVWEVDVDKPPRRKDIDMEPPYELVEMLRALHALQPEGLQTGGNMGGVMQQGASIPSAPLVCPVSPEAEAILDEWEEECRHLGNRERHSNPMRVGLYNRGYEHAAKLALIRAVSDGLGVQAITEEHARWAVCIVRSTIDANMASVEDRVAINDWERHVQRILTAITKAGQHGISRRDICRAGKGLRVDEADAVLEVLATRGEIEQVIPDPIGSRRPPPRWRRTEVGSVGSVGSVGQVSDDSVAEA